MSSSRQSLKKKQDVWAHGAYRIIDANLNRAKEGLRVCEEVSRFYLKNKNITHKLKILRHKLTDIIKTAHFNQLFLFQERDSESDIGKTSFLKSPKRSFKQIFMANAQRIKEALRVLEEFLKLFDQQASQKVQKLRFDVYALEKKSVEQFPTLLDS